jgi:hypothetical protein
MSITIENQLRFVSGVVVGFIIIIEYEYDLVSYLSITLVLYLF